MTNFSERLRELRKANNLGQKEVGAWIGVSDSSIRKYESDGSRTPNPEAIKILAKKFGVSTDYLLGFDGNSQEYYHDPMVAVIAQEMHDKPEIRVLFDATRGLKKESIEEVKRFVEFQKAKERGDM